MTGLAGAVSSIAPTHSLLASAAQDRFVRLHSTFSPPAEAGAQQERKGDVLDKLYMKVTPTVVVWDGHIDASVGTAGEAVDEDDVWDAMPVVDSDSEDEDEGKPGRRKEKKTRTA